MTTGYETVLERLEQEGLLVQTWGETKSARCPGPLHANGDSRPSLSVGEGDQGRALLFCHVGCSLAEVVDALGLKLTDLFGEGVEQADAIDVAVYTYTDANGDPLYRVHRTEPKGFWQEKWHAMGWEPGMKDVERVPFHLHKLVRSDPEETIYLVEGEKDAITLEYYGLLATTLAGGAGKWRDEYAQWFTDRNVIIVPDMDDAGLAGAERIAASLRGVAASVVLRYPATGKDISDHLLGGLDHTDLLFDPPVNIDELEPVDWMDYERPETEWLLEPYIPRTGRVLAFGAAGSLKSLWAMWLAAKLSWAGHKVAYFSLEMLKSDMAGRFQQANPNPANLKVFTKWQFGNEEQRRIICTALKGYSLIVVDSWTAAQQFTDNDKVAQLDNELFQPIIEATGACILILDNVGHPSFTDKGVMKPTWARGASAKGDKMEITMMFNRPYEDNNYCTTISVEKMRLDYPQPQPVTVSTPRDRIEFYYTEADGFMSDRPMWGGTLAARGYEDPEVAGGSAVSPVKNLVTAPATPPHFPVRRGALQPRPGVAGRDDGDVTTESPTVAAPLRSIVGQESEVGEPDMTAQERRALARLRDKLGATDAVGDRTTGTGPADIGTGDSGSGEASEA